MKFCPNCGSELSDEAMFCSACGIPVNGKQFDAEGTTVLAEEDDAEGTTVLAEEDDAEGTTILAEEDDTEGTAVLVEDDKETVSEKNDVNKENNGNKGKIIVIVIIALIFVIIVAFSIASHFRQADTDIDGYDGYNETYLNDDTNYNVDFSSGYGNGMNIDSIDYYENGENIVIKGSFSFTGYQSTDLDFSMVEVGVYPGDENGNQLDNSTTMGVDIESGTFEYELTPDLISEIKTICLFCDNKDDYSSVADAHKKVNITANI